jgi:formamidopyrimidine-DNA glycosylase
MPELPEVETIRRGLENALVGQAIEAVDVRWPGTIDSPAVDAFTAKLLGRRIVGVGRRGKYLILELTGGWYLLIHLRMTGQLLLCGEMPAKNKHIHVIFYLDDGRLLCFRNVRKFGRMYLVSDPAQVVGDLGPEPLGEELDEATFAARLREHRGMLKPLLLNQHFLAGLGNIYVDEALFASRLGPRRKANTLTEAEISDLYRAIRQVLRQGIRNRGTTLDDFCDLEGQSGFNQNCLAVFSRQESPCPRCGAEIEKTVVSGRGTYYCPECQGIA